MHFFSGSKEEITVQAVTAAMEAVKICMGGIPYDADQHKKWYTEVSQTSSTVRISEPETKGAYLKKHTTYLVTEEPHGHRVRRRFSDFEWLHTTLKNRYIGMLIPSLPEKNVIKNEAFIQSRIRGLQMFLDSVMKSPYLRSDAAVHSFFTKREDTEWEVAKKQTAVMDNAGNGHLRWIRLLTEFKCASDTAETHLNHFKRYIEQLERILTEIAASTKQVAEKSTALSKEIGSLYCFFNGWKVTETTSLENSDGVFLQLLGESANVIGKWNQVMRFQPAIYELLLHENIKYMLQQTRDLLVILHAREFSVMTLQRIQQSSSTATSGISTTSTSSTAATASTTMSSRATSLASSFAARFMKTEASTTIPEDPETAEKRAQFLSNMIKRALVAEEIERFREGKIKALQDLMSHFTCAEAQLTKKSASMWRNYLKATTVDPEALAVRTKEILEAHVTISQPDITSSTTTLQKVTTATATASSLETPGPPIPQAATSTVTAA